MKSFIGFMRALSIVGSVVAVGLVANGCGKGGSSGGGNNPSIGLHAEFVVVAQPVQVLQGQTTNLQLKVTYNGQVLNNNQYSVSASIDNPSVGTVSVDNNKNVSLQVLNNLLGVTTVVRASVGYNSESTTALTAVQVVNVITNTNSNIDVNGVPKTVLPNSTGHTIEVRLNQNGVLSQPLQAGTQYTAELLNNNSNVGLLSILNSTQYEFRANSNLGNVDLRIRVTNVNGFSGQRDIAIAFTVSTTGNGGGGTGSNEVNGPVFTALNVSSPGGMADAGVPFQMSMNATRDNSTTSDTKEVKWKVDNNSFDNGIANVDALGRLFFRNTGATAQVSIWAEGVQTSNSPERWREMLESVTQSVTSSTTSPKGLMLRYCPAYLALGQRWAFEILDLDTGVDVSLTATITFTDINGNTVTNIQRVSNNLGQQRMFEALKPGLVRVNFTTGAKSQTFHIRVGTSNPQVWQRNGKGVIDPMMYVCYPYVNPALATERKLRFVFNLKYAFNSNGGATTRANPSVYFYNDLVNGGTPMDEVIPIVADEFGDNWVVFERTYTGDSGIFDTGGFLPLGNSATPINTALNNLEFFRDRQYSAAQVVSGADDVFRLNITRGAPVSGQAQIFRAFKVETF